MLSTYCSRKIIFLCLGLVGQTFYLNAQRIVGTFLTNEGLKPEIVNVLFREARSKGKVSEFVIAFEGRFDHTLRNKYSSIVIEFNSLAFETDSLLISNPSSDSVYRFMVLLREKPPKVLEEILIKSSPNRVLIKEDTVVYRVADFAEGNEQKVQDILKKLPGIEVNERSGEIKFKGKSIEKVLLDGDDLFGLNYTLGTKNMSAATIEEVEAVEKYIDNPLLKNIIESDKVALNLKLKKGQPDFSGNINMGAGLQQEKKLAYDLDTDILGVSQRYKSFGTVQANNVGKNSSPFDYFDYSISNEQQPDEQKRAKEIIPNPGFSTELGQSRVNINRLLFGNYNGVFNVKQKLRARVNGFYFKDLINSNQRLDDSFMIGTENFNTQDDSNIKKRPFLFRGDIEMKYRATSNLIIESLIKAFSSDVTTERNTLQNQELNFLSSLISNETFFKHSAAVTRRVTEKKAFQFLSNYTTSSIGQGLVVSPSPFKGWVESMQTVKSKKDVLELQGNYFVSTTGGKMNATFGYTKVRTPLRTSLDQHSVNDLTFSSSSVFQGCFFDFKKPTLVGKMGYQVRLIDQHLNNTDTFRSVSLAKFVFEPIINLQHKIGPDSRIRGTLTTVFSENQENFFFVRRVLINNRTVIENTPDLRLRRTDKIDVSVSKDDFTNLTHLRLSLSCERTQGVFVSNSAISERFTFINYFNTPQSLINASADGLVSKYVDVLLSTFRLNTHYTFSRYLNVVNSSSLRTNFSHVFSGRFFWKTAFDGFFNFENVAEFTYIGSVTANQRNWFSNSSLSNSVKVISKVSQSIASLFTCELLIPSFGNPRSNLIFFDFMTRLTPKSAKWAASFQVRNLMNTSFFQIVETNDVSTSILTSNILPRQILAGISFSF
jgi:hypothetical protein